MSRFAKSILLVALPALAACALYAAAKCHTAQSEPAAEEFSRAINLVDTEKQVRTSMEATY
jgi:hypothetical protein